MTLDEAIRQARLAVDAPHPAGYVSDQTGISRAVLRQVLDELAATSRGMAITPAKIAGYVTLRDRFAMHAPEPGNMPSSFYPDGMRPEQRTSAIGLSDAEYAAHSARNRAGHTAACYAWADAMMAARGPK